MVYERRYATRCGSCFASFSLYSTWYSSRHCSVKSHTLLTRRRCRACAGQRPSGRSINRRRLRHYWRTHGPGYLLGHQRLPQSRRVNHPERQSSELESLPLCLSIFLSTTTLALLLSERGRVVVPAGSAFVLRAVVVGCSFQV